MDTGGEINIPAHKRDGNKKSSKSGNTKWGARDNKGSNEENWGTMGNAGTIRSVDNPNT